MKTIGLIGGMSWESSLEYYRIINEEVKKQLGGTHSARCIMYSVDFDEIEKLQEAGDWEKMTKIMIAVGLSLERAGADFIVICTNTMHKMVDDMEENLDLPILHIADATAESIKGMGLKKIALLGTNYTMEQDFYKGRLIDKHGLDVIIPEKSERDIVHEIIYKELVLGEIREESREDYKMVIEKLKDRGAEGVILGCTEIGLLIKQEDTKLPVFDTTEIHAKAAVKFALS